MEGVKITSDKRVEKRTVEYTTARRMEEHMEKMMRDEGWTIIDARFTGMGMCPYEVEYEREFNILEGD